MDVPWAAGALRTEAIVTEHMFAAMTFAATQIGQALLAAAFTADAALVVLGAGGILLVGFVLSILNLKRSRSELHRARLKAGELEAELNEVQAALYSESQVMLVWRAGNELPERMAGSLHGAAKIPTTIDALANFASWLEPDSVTTLSSNIAALRESGRAFNVGIKTLEGELLEADGRAAGAHATLRFRPLAGDRRQLTELAYDADKLAKQVQRLSAILDQAPFAIWIKGKDGALTWANQAYVKAVDADSLQSVIKGGANLFRDQQIDTSKAHPASGLLGRGRAVLRGHVHTFNVFERKLDNGIAGFAIDVTPLEEAERELERHIKAHASTLDKIDTAIAIFGPDQRLRFFNHAYAKLWGLDEDWLRSKPSDGEILDLLRTQRKLQEQANFREWKLKQLSSYTTLEMRESVWYLPDGRRLHVVCEQHPFGGVTYLYEDLTKEYQLESQFNEARNVQRETLDNLAEAVALFGSDGRLKLCNPAFETLWEITPGKADGKTEALHVDQLGKDKRYSEEVRAAWQDIRYGITGLEGGRRKLDGRIVHGARVLDYRAVPLADGNALLTFTDVSDAARAEQALRERAAALEEADKIKSDFLGHVSYEIRTPLTSIAGFAEGMSMGVVGPLSEKQNEYVMNIRRSADDLSSIIDAIIDLSAIDAGAMELKLADVDVAEVLERAASKILPALERRDLSISVEVAADVGTFRGDEQRVSQVLAQLLSNAIGFSKPGGTITLGARKFGENIQIWVADRGRGIDPAFQGKAFERFQSKPVPGGHRGPGLGLALVKSFTELHDGKVMLSSKVNQGTTVVCTFPLAGPAQAKAATPARRKGDAA